MFKKFLAIFAIFFCTEVQAQKGYSSGGSKSYSSGSSSTRSYSSPSVSKSPSVTNTKSYSPNVATQSKSYSSTSSTNVSSTSTKPKSGTFDGNAAAAQKRVESKQLFTKGSEPKTSYVTAQGKEVKIDTSSPSVQKIRNMEITNYTTREVRVNHVFHDYYSRPPVVYNDHYNSFFWFWLLDRSLDERAAWAYNHRKEMDDARYRELLAKDAKLEAKIQELERQNHGVRDSSYTPKGIDTDLQYTDDYVDSVINPNTKSSWSSVFAYIFFGIIILFILVCVVFILKIGTKL